MRGSWATGAEGWVRNERIFDAAFAPFTAAVLGAADLGSARRVLDVGCGTGTLLDAAVAAGAGAVGVDISSAMVEAARRRVPTATVVAADAQTADLLAAAPGAPFDRVVSRFGVMFFAEPEAAYSRTSGPPRRPAAPRVRVLAGGRDLHVLARPPCAHGGACWIRPSDRRPARPARWAWPTRTGYARCSPLPGGRP